MIRTAEIDTNIDAAAAKRAAKAAAQRAYRANKKAQGDAISAGLQAIEDSERREIAEREAKDAQDWARLAAGEPKPFDSVKAEINATEQPNSEADFNRHYFGTETAPQNEAGAPLAASEGTAHRIDDIPPGLKRLRAAKDAEAIRSATLADQEQGRAEAAAKIAAAQPLPVAAAADDRGTCGTKEQAQAAGRLFYGVGNFRIKKTADGREYYWGPIEAPAAKPAKAEAPVKAAKPAGQDARKDAPKPGSTSRAVYDLMIRPEGVTAGECTAAGVPNISVAAYAKDFAKSFGLEAECTKDGKTTRCWLRKPAA